MMTRIPAISVDLTDDQLCDIAPAFQKIKEAAASDQPGMLLAQIIGGSMKVFVASMDQAREMQRIMGTRVGKTSDERD
jgi:hypothetical protein